MASSHRQLLTSRIISLMFSFEWMHFHTALQRCLGSNRVAQWEEGVKAAAGLPTGSLLDPSGYSANSPKHLMDSKFNSALQSRRRPSWEDTSPQCSLSLRCYSCTWVESALYQISARTSSVYWGSCCCIQPFKASRFLFKVVLCPVYLKLKSERFNLSSIWVWPILNMVEWCRHH